ncbi:uncharacterized protein LOC125076662 [Vanessa atalanta]|uniref:uncharacterized protein LOC125076662 n=1 Tax=Vanessa atalanta TaxID=42275 RepID=UPI001FCD3C72|nr:uncharacterized protein LOC125076662 [Vanessa atalanta]
MASKLGVIMNLLNKANAKYVIQKYIEEPLLIHETKFDIRQYYLVTSTYPLIIWMYTECYLKFSSQKYSLKNYHESIHLTNNAVQKNYKNCKQRNKELPTNNMWDLDKYKCYLAKIGKDDVWQNVIYPGMKKSIIGIMLSCQDSLSVSKNRFELYGCDFILDKEFNPWLIEINSCPDLRNTTQVTAKICPAVVSDIIKVVIDYANDPKASTGKFECIYRQPISLPRYRSAAELVARGYSLPFEYFYRGKIQIQRSFDGPNITKESDIKKVLKKIKQYYDEDEIMKQPQEDDVLLNKIEEKISKSISGIEEATDVTDVINGQLGELSERITSENSSNSKCLLKKDSQQHSNQIQLISSVTNIKYLCRKSSSPLKSIQSIDNSFNFSRLDDGPAGKGSIVELSKMENLLNYSCSKFDRIHQHEIYKISNFSKDVLHATTKILSFINDKEREYTRY